MRERETEGEGHTPLLSYTNAARDGGSSVKKRTKPRGSFLVLGNLLQISSLMLTHTQTPIWNVPPPKKGRLAAWMTDCLANWLGECNQCCELDVLFSSTSRTLVQGEFSVPQLMVRGIWAVAQLVGRPDHEFTSEVALLICITKRRECTERRTEVKGG